MATTAHIEDEAVSQNVEGALNQRPRNRLSKQGVIMARVIFGNHSAVRVPRSEKDRIREFYRDVLGCKITRE